MTNIDNRIPVITDPGEFNIPWRTMQTIIAGKSLIDTFELHIESLDEAARFLKSYGSDDVEDLEKLRKTALDYVTEVLLRGCCVSLPPEVTAMSLPELLLAASAKVNSPVGEYCCVILKVCHAVAHAQWTRDEDAYEAALEKIKTRMGSYLIETQQGIWIGDDRCRIPVVEYRIKSGKKFFRMVTKLLLKEGNLSSGIYDHIGMRFVTHDIFSAILLIKFLRSRHIFMYANISPQLSKNSLAEFHQIEALFAEFSTPLEQVLSGEREYAWPGEENPFSSQQFKMIKIIERLLVTTRSGRKAFFPCELQVLTRQTQESLSGSQVDHAEYEKRQIRGVRRRLFRGTSLASAIG